jgi:pSer/pThr/pTyr-binding forkhead associated (FHA) protein
MSVDSLHYPKTVWSASKGVGSSMWKLTIVDDEGKRTDLLLSRGEYTIGRDEGNTVRLTDRNISRKHMVLRKVEGSWAVEDLNSYNGVFVNGTRVSGVQRLHHGDLIQVGDYRLEVTDEARVAAVDSAADGQSLSAPPTERLLDRPDRLVVVDGAAAGTEYPLGPERTVIGRAEDADISINHSSVSRVHAEMVKISDGIYEIFDRGSSNGVRVNGIKAERRVIEDDDEIELGDVRLRFVARGRIFHPGMLPAHAYRSADVFGTGRHTPHKRGGLGVMVAVGAVLGIVVVVAFVALQPRSTAPTGAAPTEVSANDDQSVLADAKRLLGEGNLAGAHARLAAMPEGSPLRQSKDVFDIEARWADDKFAQASTEPDPNKRRVILGDIAAATLVDAGRRKRAADELAALDQGGTDPNALPPVAAAADATPAGTLLPNGLAPNPFDDTGKGATAPAATKPAPATTDTRNQPPPASTPTSTKGADDARKEALKGSEGEDKARKMLEPRVWSGRATVDEIKMLRAICRHQRDSACAARCTAMLKEKGE